MVVDRGDKYRSASRGAASCRLNDWQCCSRSDMRPIIWSMTSGQFMATAGVEPVQSTGSDRRLTGQSIYTLLREDRYLLRIRRLLLGRCPPLPLALGVVAAL